MSKIILHCDHREIKVLEAIKKELDKPSSFKTMVKSFININESDLDICDFSICINDVPVCNIIRNQLYDEFDSPLILYESSQLTTGDYIITIENEKYPLAVIERKTLSDFAASIKDKRHYNYEKLLNLRKLTGCKIYYIIEGNLEKVNINTNIQGIKYFNIKSSCMSFQIKYDIHILYTKDIKETANQLKLLCEKFGNLYNKGELTGIIKDINLDEALIKSDFTKEQKDDRSILNMWCSINGIGEITASNLAKKFTIKEYLYNEIKLENINEFKLSDKQRKNLTKKTNIQDHIKILSCIPKMSKQKITDILTVITLDELLIIKDTKESKNDNEQIKKIKNLIKENKFKLGPKTIENINCFLNKKLN